MRSLGFVLLALAACNVQATKFTPVGGGDDGGPPPGDGTGPSAAHLSASPTDNLISLGTVLVGQTSSKAAITVSNDGDQDSGSVTITFADATLGFALVDDTCSGKPLPGHMTCTFALQFTPAIASSPQTNLDIAGDPGGTVTKVVSGTGLLQGAVDIMEASNDYGLLGLGAAPKTKIFTVRNTGQAQIGTPTPSITGDNVSYTVASTTCNAPLNQTDTCTVTVQFRPNVVGAKAGSLVIMSAPGGQDAAQLSGTGFAHVTVTRSGDGAGTVTSNPAGINCGTTCAADFTSTPVTLTTAAGTESTFTVFGGDCTGTSCSLALTANKNVDAKFTLNSYNVVGAISLQNGVPGVHKITSNPAGLNCDGVNGCTAAFKFGSQVTISAVPDAVTGRFVNWADGPCAGGTNPVCTFAIPSGGVHAGAVFTWFASLTILKNQGDGGTPAKTTATTGDSQINCDTSALTGTCIGFFGRNEQVRITYAGNPSTVWTNCRGTVNQLFLFSIASGTACLPQPRGTICNSSMICATKSECTMTFDQPIDYTSEFDVECEIGI
jgi:hypothetical protein